MRIAAMLAVAAVLGQLGCGGSSTPSAANVPNPFVGSLSITSPLPTATTNCLVSHVVTFSSAGASTQLLSVPGGDCVIFVNGEMVNVHQPAQIGTNCPELNAPGPMAPGASFQTVALNGPKTCQWQDLDYMPVGPGH